MKLQAGDVILTGTPKGVGPIHANDVVIAGLESDQGQQLAAIQFNAVTREGGFINQAQA